MGRCTAIAGGSATAPAAADAALNQALYGVRTGAEVVARFNLGGIIYFTTSHNITSARRTCPVPTRRW